MGWLKIINGNYKSSEKKEGRKKMIYSRRKFRRDPLTHKICPIYAVTVLNCL